MRAESIGLATFIAAIATIAAIAFHGDPTWTWVLIVVAVVGCSWAGWAGLTSHVYLLDFAVFEPPDEWKVSQKDIGKILHNLALHRKQRGLSHHSELDIQFQQRVLSNSGTGEATAWPPAIVQYKDKDSNCQWKPIRMCDAREEAEIILFQCMNSLLAKTHINVKKIDCLIVNCSLFSPTPSLCAMVCSKFNMRSDVKTYSISGQGCSASVVSVDIARDFLKANSHSTVVVLSTEVLSTAMYHGHDRGMLLQNTLFRSGGAGICMTNKWHFCGAAKFVLHSLVRTQVSTTDAYSAVYETEDLDGNLGVKLSKTISEVASAAITTNLKTLAPLVLPLSEQVKVLLSIKKRNGKRRVTYTPHIKKAVQHLCIHTGGKGVLDALQTSLRLSDEDMKCSRDTLNKRGNTSSSSIWYELDSLQKAGLVKSGQNVLQLAFGSGFKCNSVVWKRL